MGRIEKTVFISYRRTDEAWGLAVFQDLTQHGYDVFIDYDGIASGNFETVILENIRARAHFLVLLTATALERCGDPEDWMRREIEAALDSQRNIVPLMLEGFDFGTPATASQLTGKLAALKKYNGLPIPKGYFSAAMERLRNKFLNVQVDAVLHPTSDSAQQVAKEQKDKAASEAKRRSEEDARQREAEEERRKREAEMEQRRKEVAEAKRQEDEAQRAREVEADRKAEAERRRAEAERRAAEDRQRGESQADALAVDVVKDTTTQNFAKDVIEESKRQPVLVDFSADWCVPCKQLTPVLEKVVKAAKGKVKLVKMDIEKHPSIPSQLGIQTIPAVIAYVDAQPADGFIGALSENQVIAFLERLLGR